MQKEAVWGTQEKPSKNQATTDVSKGGIFDQEQLSRAVELGLGASGPDEIEIIPLNTQAQDICSKIKNEFDRTG